MPKVTALQSFDHGGSRRTGDMFDVSERHAKELAARGLVRIVGDSAGDPTPAAGTPLSASPAAQASPQTTVKQSGAGGKKGKAAASSS